MTTISANRILLLPLLLLIAIAVGLTFVMRTYGGGSSPDITDVSGYLYGRTSLSVCVDAVGEGAGSALQGATQVVTSPEQTPSVTAAQTSEPTAAPTSELTAMVEVALSNALATVDVVPEEYANPSVSAECPPATKLDQSSSFLERNTLNSSSQIVGSPDGPTSPSPFRVVVYVVPDSQFETTFGARSYASSTEEYVCISTCIPVTRGLYVPSSNAQKGAQQGFLETLDLLTEAELKQLLQEQIDDITPKPTP